MSEALHIIAVEVSAGCYPRSFDWKNAECLAHAVEVDRFGEFIRVLCRGVKLGSLLDDSAIFYKNPINCPRCLAKLKPPTI